MADSEQTNAARLAYIQNSGGNTKAAASSATAAGKRAIKRTILMWLLGIFFAILPWLLLIGAVLVIIIVIIGAIPDVIL